MTQPQFPLASTTCARRWRRGDRHRRRRLHRHAGPAAGQADPRPVLPRHRARARHRGLQLPARRRRRHEHRRRLRDQLVGARLRRLGVRARPRHAAPLPVAARAPRWCSATWPGSTRTTPPSSQSPRQILRPQVDRAAGARAGRVRRHRARVHRLQRHLRARPGRAATATSPRRNQYNVDYSLLGTSRVEPLLRDIRNGMYAAGLGVESAKGECNLGQHEIAFKYDEVVRTADHHSVYKNGAKEIAAQHGKALDLHGEVRRARGQLLPHPHEPARRRRRDRLRRGRRADPDVRAASWPASRPRCASFTLLYAPNINSYKRFQPGSFAPTAIAWGQDNRTCALRVVGHGAGLRLENRLPGGDVNPYLALAGMLAGGLHGIEHELELEPAFEGNAYASDKRTRADDAAGGPRPVRRPRRWPGRPSATRSSTTTSTTPTSSWPPSTRPSPTGSAFRGFETDVTRCRR